MGLRFHRKRGGGSAVSPEIDWGGVCGFTVENYPELHKPVEIADLGPCGRLGGVYGEQ